MHISSAKNSIAECRNEIMHKMSLQEVGMAVNSGTRFVMKFGHWPGRLVPGEFRSILGQGT